MLVLVLWNESLFMCETFVIINHAVAFTITVAGLFHLSADTSAGIYIYIYMIELRHLEVIIDPVI